MHKSKITWWRVNLSKENMDNVASSIKKENISMGKVTRDFEKKISTLLNVPYALATSSGSTALLISLMGLGIKSGDEVIVPERTWIATANAPYLIGAKPVLVDVLKDKPIIDTSQIRKKITKRTKAIMPVQLNGNPVAMEEIWKIAEEYNLHVVEDAAQALFSKYKNKFIGTQSSAGCFSFSMPKLLPTGQGGLVVTKNKNLFEKLKLIRTHGTRNVNHGTPYEAMGFNFRYTDIQASLGISQLNNIKNRVKKLKVVYQKYFSEIKKIDFLDIIPVNFKQGQIPLYVEVLCKRNRGNFINYLLSNNIETRPFYPNINSAKHLKQSGRFPNSKKFNDQGLVLPCGPDQPLKNIDIVLEAIKKWK